MLCISGILALKVSSKLNKYMEETLKESTNEKINKLLYLTESQRLIIDDDKG